MAMQETDKSISKWKDPNDCLQKELMKNIGTTVEGELIKQTIHIHTRTNHTVESITLLCLQ